MTSPNKVRIDLELKGEELVERGLKNVGDAADKAGDDLTGMAKDAGFLKTKITETEAEIKRLTKTINETGDLNLLKSIRKETTTLRSLKKLLPDDVVEEATDVGVRTGRKFGEGLTRSLLNMRGPGIAALVGLGLAASPGISAAIAGAVLGAAGTGGIIGGVAAAAQDQRIQDEAKRVGKRFASALTDTGGPFVEPLIESLRILDDAGDRFANNLAKLGGKLAPVLVPLTKGVAGFGDEVMPGLVKAADAMKPVIRAIANELPKIGREISDFFSTISEDSDGAVLGIVAISQAIRGTIRTAGELISALSKVYSASLDTGIAISGVMKTIFGWIPLAGDAISAGRDALLEQRAALGQAKDASEDFAGNGIRPIIRAEEEVTAVTKTATDAIEDQIKAMDKMVGRVLDAQELASNYQESIDNLTRSVKENGGSLDLNTEKGRNNAKILREQVEAIAAIAQETYRRTGDIATTDQAFQQMVETLRRQAIELGINKDAVNAFVDSLLAAQGQWDVEVRAPGLLAALERARELNRLMGSISSGARARGGDTSGYGGGRAGGGPMQPGKFYTVGEDGIEVVAMHPGGGATVYNNKQTGAMLSGASGGASGGSTGGWVAVVSAKDGASQWLAQMIDVRIERAVDHEAALAAGGPR